jgi:twinkle protein
MKDLDNWAEEEYPTYQSSKESWDMQQQEQSNVTEFVKPMHMAYRGITKETMEFYDCKTFIDGKGEPVRQEYIYPSGGVKVRQLPKTFSARNLKTDELFGMNLWNSGTSKIITITEGELDAMSAYQMLYNPKFDNPVVSLPSSTPSHKLWEKINKFLSSFDKIVLSIEHDDQGNSVAAKIASLYPNKVYRMELDKYKDANEFLQEGQDKTFKSAWFNARKYTPANILNTPDQFLNLYNRSENHVYVETGIQDFDDMCLGLMQGHFTLFKAQTGIGKTEFMRYLEYRILSQYPDIKIATWHMEETKLRSILGLVSYELNDNVTRKDLIEEKNADDLVQEAITKLTKDERLYQFFLNDEDDPLDLLSQIRYLSQACDVNYVFFEPIQDISANAGTEDSKEQFLADLSVRLSKLAAELGVGIVTIGHTNDDGQVKYCRMIEQRASVVVDLQRDKMSEDREERNTTKLLVTKNRPVGPTGYAGQLQFDPDSFTLKEKYAVY